MAYGKMTMAVDKIIVVEHLYLVLTETPILHADIIIHASVSNMGKFPKRNICYGKTRVISCTREKWLSCFRLANRLSRGLALYFPLEMVTEQNVD